MKMTVFFAIGIPVVIAVYFFVGAAIREYFRNN